MVKLELVTEQPEFVKRVPFIVAYNEKENAIVLSIKGVELLSIVVDNVKDSVYVRRFCLSESLVQNTLAPYRVEVEKRCWDSAIVLKVI